MVELYSSSVETNTVDPKDTWTAPLIELDLISPYVYYRPS